MREPLLVANWKMNLSRREARVLVEDLLTRVGDLRGRQLVLCPPFHLLMEVGALLEGRPGMALGAQDCHWEEAGAYTGEISAPMLRDAGCRFVILGHSERRALFGETDQGCARKVGAALAHGLTPILCVGETLPERESGRALERVSGQLLAGLEGISLDHGDRLVVAYEPIWAIGTGRTDSPEGAARVLKGLRGALGDRFGERIAGQVRLLYGGSVKPENIDGFMAWPDIDGALVGGAALKADSFARIVGYQGGPRGPR